MPDDSRPPISFADALRGWTLEALKEAEGDRQFGSEVRAELERRAPCTCYIAGSVSHERWRQRLHDCPRHQGRRP